MPAAVIIPKSIYVLIIMLFFNCLGACTVYSQVVDSLIVDFKRKVLKNGIEEITEGTIYYSAQRTVLDVTNPLNQIIIIEESQMTIYYPDESNAIIYKNYHNPSLPLFQIFLNITKEDFGLSENGFTLENNVVTGDTLTTYWELNVDNGELKMVVETVLVTNKYTSMSIYNENHQLLSKTKYGNYYLYKGYFFPLQINKTEFKETDISEEIVFFNPNFNADIPTNFKYFVLPRDTEIKEITW